jgi:hypothetical protein
LRFFFSTRLRRNDIVEHTHFIQGPRGLPVTLSVEEVARLLDAASVLKYKAGTGLRANDRSPATRASSQQRPVHRASCGFDRPSDRASPRQRCWHESG